MTLLSEGSLPNKRLKIFALGGIGIKIYNNFFSKQKRGTHYGKRLSRCGLQ